MRSSNSKHGAPEDIRSDIGMTENPREQPDPSVSNQNVHEVWNKEAPAPRDAFAEINMEVSITADDVLRAGGFGATDNITGLLPVASDFTDFEDHLPKVRGYEDSEDSIAGGQSNSPKDTLEVEEVGIEDTDDVKEHVAPATNDAYEAVSMEASVTPDEMIRAGGFGATDDISSFLPVASDFTDFEANLRDARGYEDLNEEIKRPGLGWTNETK
ncbi:hypothetical protein CDL12_06268 [Handroanthus impetiginosus]|uniref:Uncharacterized protein n=1 Tax=Handroanthus impetiginosus TaxID=429701 RepID=A0A2G9HU32_9LAMI|nr:hypothetical protein CDL12_06268 [Handroanthus impetiginosus]